MNKPVFGKAAILMFYAVAVTLTVVEPDARADEQQPPAETPPVLADGTGLPEGQGTAVLGASLYAERCSGCHGPNGEGGSALELIGDPATLASDYPDRGIGVFWPYAPPLFDYIRRAMPPSKPWSLSADETYAIVAWLLMRSELAAADEVVDADYLSSLTMPNRDGFIRADK